MIRAQNLWSLVVFCNHKFCSDNHDFKCSHKFNLCFSIFRCYWYLTGCFEFQPPNNDNPEISIAAVLVINNYSSKSKLTFQHIFYDKPDYNGKYFITEKIK